MRQSVVLLKCFVVVVESLPIGVCSPYAAGSELLGDF